MTISARADRERERADRELERRARNLNTDHASDADGNRSNSSYDDDDDLVLSPESGNDDSGVDDSPPPPHPDVDTDSEDIDDGGVSAARAAPGNRPRGRPIVDDVPRPNLDGMADAQAEEAMTDFKKEKNRLAAKRSPEGRKLAQSLLEYDCEEAEELRTFAKIANRLNCEYAGWRIPGEYQGGRKPCK